VDLGAVKCNIINQVDGEEDLRLLVFLCAESFAVSSFLLTNKSEKMHKFEKKISVELCMKSY
jgi:hypothetical protein